MLTPALTRLIPPSWRPIARRGVPLRSPSQRQTRAGEGDTAHNIPAGRCSAEKDDRVGPVNSHSRAPGRLGKRRAWQESPPPSPMRRATPQQMQSGYTANRLRATVAGPAVTLSHARPLTSSLQHPPTRPQRTVSGLHRPTPRVLLAPRAGPCTVQGPLTHRADVASPRTKARTRCASGLPRPAVHRFGYPDR
ncbi:hypothetical protein C2E23DRAFT_602319 [Lenzites betulinus]|nr:hypothetical protein C2E23DRAFT_602319 [Lenzites betulinus]